MRRSAEMERNHHLDDARAWDEQAAAMERVALQLEQSARDARNEMAVMRRLAEQARERAAKIVVVPSEVR